MDGAAALGAQWRRVDSAGVDQRDHRRTLRPQRGRGQGLSCARRGTLHLMLGAAAAACGARQAAEAPARGDPSAGQLVYGHYSADPARNAVWDGVLAKFRARHPGIAVEEVVPPNAEYGTRIQAMVAAGQAPDVFSLGYGPLFRQFADQGRFLALDALVRRDARAVNVDDFWSAARQVGVVQGKRLAMPREGINLACVFVSLDLLAAHGLPAPPELGKQNRWTWDTFLDLAQRVTRRSGDRFESAGALDWLAQLSWTMPVIWTHGGDLLSKEGTRAVIDQAPAIAAVQLQADLLHRYRVAASGQEGGQLEQAGKLAFRVAWAGRAGVYRRYSYRWDIAPYPTGKGGKATQSTHHVLLINKETRQVEPAWTFVKYFSGPEADLDVAVGYGVMPMRRSNLPRWKERLRAEGGPPSLEVYDELLAAARPGLDSPRAGEIGSIYSEEIAQVVAGTRVAPEALRQMARRINAVLQG